MPIIGVIFGGRSGEHEVSLVSATAVINNMPSIYTVLQIGITKDGRWYTGDTVLEDFKNHTLINCEELTIKFSTEGKVHFLTDEKEFVVDLLFPVLHGTFGEDGTIQGLFEMMNVPYVGSGVIGSSMAMDKIIAKQIWRQHGLPIAPYLYTDVHQWQKNKDIFIENILSCLGLPCFVKPANLGSSVGITKVKHLEELEKAIEAAFLFDRKIIVEKAINARELECAILGNADAKASAVGEVIVGGEFYSFNDKYVDGVSSTQIPAELDTATQDNVKTLSLKAFKALECRGLARVDSFLDRDTGEIYLNELNTMPGFTSISMYPKLWMNSGITYTELLDLLINFAFEEFKEKNLLTTDFSSQSDWYK